MWADIRRIPGDEDRLTLPEVMRAIELQSKGASESKTFSPPGCEHAVCSFHGSFVLMPDGKVKALSRWSGGLFLQNRKS